MRKEVLILLLCALVLTRSVNRTPPHGWYDRWFHVIHCEKSEECLHEIGHAVDQDLRDISQTQEFQDAVQVYIRVAWLQRQSMDEWQEQIAFFPGVGSPLIQPFYTEETWGGYAELYAEMLKWANGDVSQLPKDFRKFYCQALIDRYMEETIR